VPGLIALDIAALLTWVSVWLHNLLWSQFGPESPSQRLLDWPVGILICRSFYDYHSGTEMREAMVNCYVAVTWCKLTLLTVLADWLCGGRLIRKRAEKYLGVLVACLCPFLLVLLGEFGKWGIHNLAEVLPPWLTSLFAGANILVLLGIAFLDRPRLQRVAFSIPCWLVWLAWTAFGVTSVLVLLAAVPVLSFFLYCVALQERSSSTEAANPV
jgi:hypothetical protein